MFGHVAVGDIVCVLYGDVVHFAREKASSGRTKGLNTQRVMLHGECAMFLAGTMFRGFAFHFFFSEKKCFWRAPCRVDFRDILVEAPLTHHRRGRRHHSAYIPPSSFAHFRMSSAISDMSHWHHSIDIGSETLRCGQSRALDHPFWKHASRDTHDRTLNTNISSAPIRR